jgi:hypothetical protein
MDQPFGVEIIMQLQILVLSDRSIKQHGFIFLFVYLRAKA